ncbi:MAG: ABC transporter permease [Reichenbachiella sp.]
MFKNFLTLAYRHFVRSPLTSFIQGFGLTAAFTVSILIMMWVVRELQADHFVAERDLVYRLESSDEQRERTAIISPSIAPLLKEYLPEVEEVVRIGVGPVTPNRLYRVKEGSKEFFPSGRSRSMDSSFYQVFPYEFISGNPQTALTNPRSIVISRRMAEGLFGTDDVLNEWVFGPDSIAYTISGVIDNIPHTHMPTDILGYFRPGGGGYSGHDVVKTWRYPAHPTYLRVRENIDIAQLEHKINLLVDEHRPAYFKEIRPVQQFYLRPLKEIYLTNNDVLENGFFDHGNSNKVIAFATIAIMILILATINFINLNTAKSFERAKEVGMKRISGASHRQIFIQFIGEATLTATLSFLLAIIFVDTLLPYFNTLMGSDVSFLDMMNLHALIFLLLSWLGISLLSGVFPSLYIISLEPIMAVKGAVQRVKGFNAKKANLIFQFALIMILIVGFTTAYRQIDFMKNRSLGFDIDNRVYFQYSDDAEGAKSLKQSLLSNPNIFSATKTMTVPGVNNLSNGRTYKFNYLENEYNMNPLFVDEDFQETFGLKMAAGRFFSKDHPLDYEAPGTKRKWVNTVLNETAVELLGLQNPVGSVFRREGKDFRVIGVFKDFHLNSLTSPIPPVFVLWVSPWSKKMTVHISQHDQDQTLQFIAEQVQSRQEYQVTLRFLKDAFEAQYGNDENFTTIIGYITLLAIIIAGMGLLGVSAHSIKIRIKEIGIRKTMGASTIQVLILLVRGFVGVIIIATIIAAPIAWEIMDQWLQDYPYRIDQNIWVFAFAGGITILIAFMTVFWNSWRASSMNPARLIRYE